ncbi:MAG: ABC transporter permease [Bacteroidales bacterium]|jgi:ABC-2 type transport system permease protein|nr:ABC transporter permease [Bacteroidales bacterium]
MNKIALIFKREFITRIRNKAFIIMTFLGPLLLAGIFIIPMWLEKMQKEEIKKVAVIDETHLLASTIKDYQSYRFTHLPDKTVEEVRENIEELGFDAVLFIPRNIYKSNWAVIYSNAWVDDALKAYVSYVLRRDLEYMALMKENVDADIIKRVSTPVFVGVQKWSKDGTYIDEESALVKKSAIAFGVAFLLYFFIFIYGVLVLRGVIEEKVNRVVEIVVSSVKPFQLMVSKILGIGTVGLIQFIVWTVLTIGIVYTAQVTLFSDLYDPTPLPEMGQVIDVGDTNSNVAANITDIDYAVDLFGSLQGINWTVMISSFVLFFIFGYILYASIFAGIGAIIDQETDTQQFVLPVSLPLVLSILLLQVIISNPDGQLAFWMSLFPLTSPIIMLARLPFGIPYWQVVLSCTILILSCWGSIYVSSKMYRAGILHYGKKMSISSIVALFKRS